MGSVRGRVAISDIQGKSKVEANALFDTGSDITVVSKNLAEKAGLTVTNKIFQLTLGDKSKADYHPAFGMITVKGCKMPLLGGVLIKRDPPSECIVGLNMMELMGITLDPKTRSYTVSCKLPRV